MQILIAKGKLIVPFKIKDKLILGSVSGILPGSMMNGLDYLMLRLHLNKWHIWQLSASLFFKRDELDTIPAFFIGGVTYMLIESLAGVVLFYVLYFTGRKFYIIKGIAVFILFWVMIFGGILSLKITSVTQPLGAQQNIGHLIAHTIVGVLVSLVMVKLADKQVWD